MGQKELGALLGLRMNRRDLFNFVLGVGASALGLTAGGVALARWASQIPDRNPKEENRSDYIIFPGWIEQKVTAPFLQSDKGHFFWMREAIFNNPLVLEATQDFFAYLTRNWRLGKRVRLGDALFYCMDKAQSLLDANWQAVSPETNRVLEAVHLGLFAFAAGTTANEKWFTKEDLERFGIDVEDKSIAEYFWAKDGLAVVVFPKLFGAGQDVQTETIQKIHQEGQDRTIHFANYLLLTFEYLYSKLYGLHEHETMPNGTKKLVDFFGKGSREQEARALALITGLAYELQATLDNPLENMPVLKEIFGKGGEIVEGMFDNMVWADLKANRLGTEAAILLFYLINLVKSLNDKLLQKLFDDLNDPRFSHFETDPKLSL